MNNRLDKLGVAAVSPSPDLLEQIGREIAALFELEKEKA